MTRHVTSEPSSKPFLADLGVLYRLTPTAVAYWGVMLLVAVVLAAMWLLPRGWPDHPAYGLLVACWTYALGPGLAIPVVLNIPSGWWRVPAGERVLHTILGVGAFAWLLRASGYNRRFVHTQWDFAINRAGLPRRALSARGAASAHGASFAIHGVLAALALLTGHRWGAAWILLPAVAIHLYPVLLQRAILLRLQPLLDRLGIPRDTVGLANWKPQGTHFAPSP